MIKLALPYLPFFFFSLLTKERFPNFPFSLFSSLTRIIQLSLSFLWFEKISFIKLCSLDYEWVGISLRCVYRYLYLIYIYIKSKNVLVKTPSLKKEGGPLWVYNQFLLHLSSKEREIFIHQPANWILEIWYIICFMCIICIWHLYSLLFYFLGCTSLIVCIKTTPIRIQGLTYGRWSFWGLSGGLMIILWNSWIWIRP